MLGRYEGWNRTMVKISDNDCLLEETKADGALGSATGEVDDGEAFRRPSSSSCFSFILMASIRILVEILWYLGELKMVRCLDIYAYACWCAW
jgi:hypothetical protein